MGGRGHVLQPAARPCDGIHIYMQGARRVGLLEADIGQLGYW